MYKWILVIVFTIVNYTSMWAQKNKPSLINWVKLENLDSLMQVTPRKIMINIYAPWCGYCKSMDKEIYRNPSAAQFINENYYAVNFDAEQKANVFFNGNEYLARQKYGNLVCHDLVMFLLNGAISYPSVVILNEKKKVIAVENGYQPIFQMEGMLKYFVSESYLKEHYNEFVKKLVYAWAPTKK